MKKFLSLVLALVMVMSLVTVSAGAKDFTDNDKITYEEAVAVVSEIGVVDGDKDGSFRPTDTLTRQAAAKIICNLLLGPTTASELHADTAPYKDVAANNQFAGYIAYCQSKGIISGYADGTFRPTGTLTGYAFMKMLLGALGYDANLEAYVGPNWSINVAKQALHIGLNKGLTEEFNGLKAVTREEACLYAFRTLQADLVEYGQRLTTNINGTEVTLSSGGAQTKKWGVNQSQQTRVINIRDDEIIQFAEEYFRKLEKKPDTDDFERPGYTWLYDKNEIGTYVDWELMVAEYTKKVTGRDLYDLLGVTTLRENELTYYVDGLEPDAGNPSWFNTNVAAASKNFDREDLVRSNDKGLGVTGNGVLTQVFLDKDKKEITVTSIDTWLSKASGTYSETREYAPVDVYYDNTANKKGWNVSIEDVPTVVDVEDGDFLLVNISWKDNTNGIVVEIAEPEVLEDSTVTKYSASDGHNGGTGSKVEKLTTDGTEYKNATRAYYDNEVLYKYDETLLTDATYNVYLDPYGYFIGVDLCEGEKNYVFITGFDRPTSNMSISTAKATGIFLDGTMEVIEVNVTATNKNIDNNRYYNKAGGEYFIKWTNEGLPGWEGSYRYNRWFTYSTNAAGVYTLKPATNMVIHKYEPTANETIKTATVFLDDNVLNVNNYPYGDNFNKTALIDPGTNLPSGAPFNAKYQLDRDKNYYGERAYGNDDSVFITVDMDIVDTMSAYSRAITDVNGVYSGVQNVEIEINHDANAEEGEIYAVYDNNHYIIGAVTVGEGKGGDATIAYVLSGAKSERKEGDTYYWEFDAVVEGAITTLTAKGTYDDIFNVLTNEADASHKTIANDGITSVTVDKRGNNLNEMDGLVELRFDADKQYVTSIRPVEEKDIYSNYGSRDTGSGTVVLGTNSLQQAKRPSDVKAYRIGGLANMIGATNKWTYKTVDYYKDSAPNELTLVGRTLYVTAGQIDEGLALTSDAKAVVVQKENGSWEKTEYSSVASALSGLADDNELVDGLQYDGEIVAAVNSAGAATWVVFTNYTELKAGTGRPIGGSGRITKIDVIGNGWDDNPSVGNLNSTAYAPGSGDRELGYSNPNFDYYNASPVAPYGAAPGSYGSGNLTYQLLGSVKDQTYSVTLQTLAGTGWVDYQTWNVTAKADNGWDRHYVGILSAASQWRLVCGEQMAAVTVTTR